LLVIATSAMDPCKDTIAQKRQKIAATQKYLADMNHNSRIFDELINQKFHESFDEFAKTQIDLESCTWEQLEAICHKIYGPEASWKGKLIATRTFESGKGYASLTDEEYRLHLKEALEEGRTGRCPTLHRSWKLYLKYW
jgi:predicted transposase YbfD/YdcC